MVERRLGSVQFAATHVLWKVGWMEFSLECLRTRTFSLLLLPTFYTILVYVVVLAYNVLYT